MSTVSLYIEHPPYLEIFERSIFRGRVVTVLRRLHIRIYVQDYVVRSHGKKIDVLNFKMSFSTFWSIVELTH